MRPLILGIVLLATACGRGEVFQIHPPVQLGQGGGSGVTGQGGGAATGGGTGGEGGGGGGGGGVGTGGGVGGGGAGLALTEQGGCGDTYFYAANPEDTAMVTVYWPDLVAAVKQAGRTSDRFVTAAPLIGSGPVALFRRGKYVRDFVCGDIIRPDSQAVQGALKSGWVKVEITLPSAPGASGPWGTLTLEQAVFVDPSGGELRLEKLIVGPVLVGWLPG